MTQVNKYTDRAAYRADAAGRGTQSAVSMVESESAAIYDGVNVVVGKDAAEAGDAVVWDGANGAIRFVKGATLSVKRLPANLVPLAVVYARQGERLRVAALANAGGQVRWAHPYQVALSGFDLQSGGTFVLRINKKDFSYAYPAGASLASLAALINADTTLGAVYGWAAEADEHGQRLILSANTWSPSYATIDDGAGCVVIRTPEDRNYQTLPAGLLAGSSESVRRRNGFDSSFAGCNEELFGTYYAVNGSVATGIAPGSGEIVCEDVFTPADNPELASAYPTYRAYLYSEHLLQYPSACAAMLRDGKDNTAKIGSLRFVNIRGESAPCYPAAAAALEYGVTIEGAVTGLEAGAWWLPSVEEMNLLMRGRALNAAERERDPVNRTLARIGAATLYATEYAFWAANEYSFNQAYFYYRHPGTVDVDGKYYPFYVRPVSCL